MHFLAQKEYIIMNPRLLKKITQQQNNVAQFIDSMRDIFSKTPNESEKINRFEVFDTLLLLATYAQPEMLEHEFQSVLPQNEGEDTLSYLCEKLREINGFCSGSFSDEHGTYQDLFSEIKFPTSEKKQAARDLLSKAISEIIFEKTNTESNRLSISK